MDTETIEGSTGAPTKARRGRRPASTEQVGTGLKAAAQKRAAKKAKPEENDIPIDGDHNGFLEMRVTDPRWPEQYVGQWVGPHGLAKFRYRGYVEVRWGEGIEPACSYQEGTPGEPIVYQELRYMKLSKDRARLIQENDRKRLEHKGHMRTLAAKARETGGKFTRTATFHDLTTEEN